ncbi:AGE family epimerase/isomerase [Rhodophyticola sp. CCM32]|uniref:AGE family epimerase/isomerase n=1 Tax=Rhodophyticola sp. CCM32 TaxID=2916397 RepID=UPI00107F6EEA|nr:AGE family epimerase/isomerase [Rhodophyticola sp. CCM32]QBY01228.1 AGE family epimerase/isomerase [Rhodophyticola sp. CCM32]
MNNPKYDFQSAQHMAWLKGLARKHLDVFRRSLRPSGGFYTLDRAGTPLDETKQEIHYVTRMVHSYALGHLSGVSNCGDMIDQGMTYLWSTFRDHEHGGYFWSVDGAEPSDGRKLNYGHVFVLLAASSAKKAGHPDADRMIDDITDVLNTRFWESGPALFADEFTREWSAFSTYRGMNSNMHGTEALLNAYEATGDAAYLEKADHIIRFFLRQVAPKNNHRLPEHYTETWDPDWAYSENPMFRPAGTTPGHSFEMARLLLQYWDGTGRPDDGSVQLARAITDRAFDDAWCPDHGGIYYTLTPSGAPHIKDRYWWPTTEAIGVVAALLKVENDDVLKDWYHRLWAFCDAHFLDHAHGGWHPEIDAAGRPSETQFVGKPDVYHGLQAELFPQIPTIAMTQPDVFSNLLAE